MFQVPIQDSLHILTAKPWKAATELVKYLMSGKSLFSEPYVHMAIFVPSRLLDENMEVASSHPLDLDSDLPQNIPDIQLKPIPVAGVFPPPDLPPDTGMFTIKVSLIQPKSVGYIRLSSSDPYQRANSDLGYLTAPEDVEALNKGVRLALRLSEHIRAQGYPIKDFLIPASETQSDMDASSSRGGRVEDL
jgi:hypothetical protein